MACRWKNGQGMVRNFLDDWKSVRREIKKQEARGRMQYASATLVTATLFAPTLTKTANEFTQLTKIPLDVAPITNERLGETIIVSGLLMGEDVIHYAIGFMAE